MSLPCVRFQKFPFEFINMIMCGFIITLNIHETHVNLSWLPLILHFDRLGSYNNPFYNENWTVLSPCLKVV